MRGEATGMETCASVATVRQPLAVMLPAWLQPIERPDEPWFPRPAPHTESSVRLTNRRGNSVRWRSPVTCGDVSCLTWMSNRTGRCAIGCAPARKSRELVQDTICAAYNLLEYIATARAFLRSAMPSMPPSKPSMAGFGANRPLRQCLHAFRVATLAEQPRPR